MDIWRKAKDASVAARLMDENYHARALSEIRQGHQRDGLWAKALTTKNGNEKEAKVHYFKLLVQAIKDEDYIVERSGLGSAENESELVPEAMPELPAQNQSAIKRPSFLKKIWFWSLVVLATSIVLFGFLPLVLDGKATFAQYLICVFWGFVIHYALKKLYPPSHSS